MLTRTHTLQTRKHALKKIDFFYSFFPFLFPLNSFFISFLLPVLINVLLGLLREIKWFHRLGEISLQMRYRLRRSGFFFPFFRRGCFVDWFFFQRRKHFFRTVLSLEKGIANRLGFILRNNIFMLCLNIYCINSIHERLLCE